MSQRVCVSVGLFLVGMIACGTRDTPGAELRVPDQYKTLAEALGAAKGGTDRIVITDGKVHEGIVVAKDLTLVSEPPGAQIVSAGGSGVTIGQGVSRVILEGLTIAASPDNGVLIEGGESGVVELVLKGVAVRGNKGFGILARSGGKHRILLDSKTTIEGNEAAGIRSLVPIALTVTDTEIKGNKAEGILLGSGESNKSPFTEPANVTLRASKIADNGLNGLAILDDMRIELTADNSQITGNDSGIYITPLGPMPIKIHLTNCAFSRNRSIGLFVQRPVDLAATSLDASNNGQAGLRIHRDTSYDQEAGKRGSALRISDSHFDNNGDCGFLFAWNLAGDFEFRDSTFSGNRSYGFRAAQNDGFSLRLCIENSVFEKNHESGLSLIGRSTTAKVSRQCVFSGNEQVGVELHNTERFQLADSRAEGNTYAAIRFDSGRDPEVLRTDITLENCSFSHSKGTAVSLARFGETSVRLEARNCEWNDNSQGLHTFGGTNTRLDVVLDNVKIVGNKSAGIKTTDNNTSMTLMGNTEIADNGAPGMMISNPLSLTLTDVNVSGNKIAGLEVRGLKAVTVKDPSLPERPAPIVLTRCAVQSNKGPGIWLIEDVNPVLSVEDTAIENNASGIWVEPADAYVARIALKRSKIVNNSERGILIADPFMTATGMNKDGIAPSTPVLAVSARCVLRLSGDTVMDNSSRNIAFEAFVGRIVGCDPASLALLSSDWEAFSPPAKVDASVASPDGADSPEVNTPVGFATYFRRIEAVSNLLGMAEAWHIVGRSEDSRSCMKLAGDVASKFRPANPNGYTLPKDLADRIRDVQALQETKTETPIEKLIQLDSSGQEEPVALCVRKRLDAYYSVLAWAEQSRSLPDLASSFRPKESSDAVVQQYLDDAVQLLSSGVSPRAFSSYSTLFCDSEKTAVTPKGKPRHIVQFLSPSEQADAMDWLTKKVESLVDVPVPLSVQFHWEMARVSRYLDDKSRETKELETVVAGEPGTDRTVKALERLAELYETYWKVPEKAVEAQRRIAEQKKGTTQDYEARLKIAKGYYNQKDYAQCVFELTRLLGDIPPNIDPKPVRTMLGMAYVGQGDMEAARNEFAVVINADTGEYREKCLYLTGYTFISEQKYSEAIKPLKDLVNLYPNGDFAKKGRDFLQKIDTMSETK